MNKTRCYSVEYNKELRTKNLELGKKRLNHCKNVYKNILKYGLTMQLLSLILFLKFKKKGGRKDDHESVFHPARYERSKGEVCPFRCAFLRFFAAACGLLVLPEGK